MTVHGVRPPIRQRVTSVDRERAFGLELCRRHAEALALVASVILEDDDAADEVVSDTIAAACRFADQPDTREVTHAQLARSVYHRCMGRLARDERFSWTRPDSGNHGSRRLATSALTTSPISQRAAAALVLFGDHDLAQAAATLNQPLTVVTGHLRNALAKIRAPIVSIVARPDASSAWIRLVGDIDLTAEPALARAADRLTVLPLRFVVIDLTAVTFTCSTLANFLAALHHAHPHAELVLRHPSPMARTVVMVTGMHEIVTMRREAMNRTSARTHDFGTTGCSAVE